jgi:cytochrome c biogenesis protein CcmG, thiol:disulfide interchange protein DsbE
VTRALKLGGQGLALLAILGLLALLVWRLTHQDHPPKIGSPAPAFDLRRLGGTGRIDLASLHGKVVVINFWASWCGPCKAEAPALERLWNRYRSRGAVVIGVDYHDVTQDGLRFVNAHALTFPMVEDGSGSVTTGRYGITVVPETWVVDRKGRLVAHMAGPISSGAFARQLAQGLRAALHS